MKRRFVATAALVALVGLSSQVTAEPVDIELVFAADGSGSIDDEELAFQRAGYAAAITNSKVLSTIRSGFHQKIAVAYVEWGSALSQHTIVDWTIIDGLQNARAFADQLLRQPRQAIGYNSISEAIAYSQDMIETNDYEGVRRIIDISADSGNYGGRPILMARGDAIAANITINALVINRPGSGLPALGPGSLAEYFEQSVIGGFGAFVVVARDRAEFADAILKKMILEIARPHKAGCVKSLQDGSCRMALR